MQSVKRLFYTTVALTLTSFLMKTIGVWFNVYLTGLVGTVGMGIFQLVMTVYAMAKTIAYGGMNLAATRLCIDDFKHARHSMARLFLCSLSLGLFALFLLFFLSDFLARVWIGSVGAGPSLRILSLSLPFVSISAALNGYMTAARRMSRYSVIQLLEQVAKIGGTVFLVGIAIKNKNAMEQVCLAITFSEVVSFLLAALCYRRDVKKDKMEKGGKKGFFKRFSRLAVPDALGAYIRSALNTVEHLLIPIGIRKSGLSADKAFSDYGIVQGMALPIVLYPSSILGVLSSLLVPEIAECKNKKQHLRQNYMINRVLSLAMIFAMVCSAVMMVFSEELGEVIYKTREAGYFIRLLAPLVPIMYLDMTTDGMLKGLDQQLSIMKINVLDSILCVLLVLVLVPRVAVDGYIITIYVAEIINFILSFRRLAKSASLQFAVIKSCLLPLSTALLSCYLGRYLMQRIPLTSLSLTVWILFAVVLDLIFLRLLGGISKGDLTWFLGVIGRKKKED